MSSKVLDCELSTFNEIGVLRHRVSFEPKEGYLCGEDFTALRSTSFKHKTTIFCCHPGTETMSTLAFDNARLESSFHDIYSENVLVQK